MDDRNMKRILAGTAVAGAFGLATLGIGSGIAMAKPHNPGPNPSPAVGHNGPAGNHNGNGNAGSYDDDQDYDNGDDYDNDDDNGDVEDGTAGWFPGMPPGQNPLGAPGQVKKLPTIGGVTNPFYGIPPGHWGDVDITVPETWQPDLPGVTEPLELQFNAELGQWGVYVNGDFVPYPIPLPAPQG